MNFCMVNAFFYPYIGGSEKHMYELGRRVAKEENFHVLTSQLNGTKKEETFQKMKVHRVPANMYKMPLIYPPPMVFCPSAKTKLEELDKKHDFDLFNLHGRWFPDFAYCVRYANRHKKLSTLTLHNARPLGISPIVSLLGTFFDLAYGVRVLKHVDRIISVSAAAKEDISNYGIDKKKIEVIHNGVDTKVMKPSKKTYKEKYGDGFDNLLIFQGRIIKQKGLDYLLKAMPEILEEYPSTRLLIIGKGGMLPQLQKMVKKLGIEKNVVFPGFIPEKELPNMFSSPDVFVLPSLWEVLPITLLEALSCGVPLLASDAGGNPEIIKQGKNGYIFRKKNNPEMIEKLRIMLDDSKLRKKMGKESRKIALNEFDWEIITDKTLDFYDKTLDEFYA